MVNLTKVGQSLYLFFGIPTLDDVLKQQKTQTQKPRSRTAKTSLPGFCSSPLSKPQITTFKPFSKTTPKTNSRQGLPNKCLKPPQSMPCRSKSVPFHTRVWAELHPPSDTLRPLWVRPHDPTNARSSDRTSAGARTGSPSPPGTGGSTTPGLSPSAGVFDRPKRRGLKVAGSPALLFRQRR